MGLVRKLLSKQKDDLIVKGVVPGEPSDVWPVLIDFASWPRWLQGARGHGLEKLDVLEAKADVGTRFRMDLSGGRSGEFKLTYKVEPSVFSLDLQREAARGFGGVDLLIFDFALKHHPNGTEIWWRPMWAFPKEAVPRPFSRWPARVLRGWISEGLARLPAHLQTQEAKEIVKAYYARTPVRDRHPLLPAGAVARGKEEAAGPAGAPPAKEPQ